MKKFSGSSSQPYKYIFSPQAKDDLDALSTTTKKAIAKKLRYYLESGDPLQFSKPLINHKLGQRRFRIGNYRVIFDVQGGDIVVLRVRNRRDLY